MAQENGPKSYNSMLGGAVLFNCSYKKASRYEFYSGCPAVSYTSIRGRKDQYYIWDSEAALQGKTIMYVPNWDEKHFDSISTLKGMVYYTFIENFRSYSNVKPTSKTRIYKRNNHHPFPISLRFDYTNQNLRDFEANKNSRAFLSYLLFQNDKLVIEKETALEIKNGMLNTGVYYEFCFEPPENGKGEYDLYLSLQNGILLPSANCDKIKIEIP